jgi:4a-hydroxytetrahydrobiopterin dehydratase
MTELASRTCEPCRDGVPPIKGATLYSLQQQLEDGWQVVDERFLERKYKFKDFKDALAFTVKVGELAEQQDHHPDVYLAFGKVDLKVWTHKVDGLTENDFIFAAKLDDMNADGD